MDGDVVGPVGQALVQRPPEALRRVLRQSGDQIHVHMGKAHTGGQCHGLLHVTGRMAAADGGEDVILQRLRINADAVYAVIQQHLQLLPLDGVRPSGLDAVFHAARQIEAAIQVGQQPVHLIGRERGGSTAPHVERLDVQPRFLHHSGGVGDLPVQHLQIRLHQSQRPLHGLGYKAAIGAAGGAEGDANIQGDILRLQLRLGSAGGLRRLDAQAAALRRDEVGVPQDPVHLPFRHALLQHPGGQLAGADARQRPPAGGDAGDLPCRLEEA